MGVWNSMVRAVSIWSGALQPAHRYEVLYDETAVRAEDIETRPSGGHGMSTPANYVDGLCTPDGMPLLQRPPCP